MTPFLDAILAFPTALFTTAMGVVLTYWLFVIVGAVGIDLLDGGHVDFESGGKALAGSLEGGAKAAGEALQGGGKAMGSHDHGADVEGGILSTLGFAGIPLTVSVSLVSFFAWFLSLLTTPLAHGALGALLPSWLISGVLGLLCFLAGLVISGFAVRPLRPVFVAQKAPGRDSLMGRVCTISSGSVTDRNGHATFEDGGAGFILNVVCAKTNGLKRGDPALVLAYDAQRDVYEVEPVDWLLPEEMAQLRDPERAAALARSRART
ncbi:YqiJ family protein [Myxococcus stipitatus]|uniref:hypothetical protein n=1 Tax=Myxococcus stipitatus TaxID=83455 RepID=UPI0031456037